MQTRYSANVTLVLMNCISQYVAFVFYKSRIYVEIKKLLYRYSLLLHQQKPRASSTFYLMGPSYTTSEICLSSVSLQIRPGTLSGTSYFSPPLTLPMAYASTSMLTCVLWPDFPAYRTPVMAVSDSVLRAAPPLPLRDALLPLPMDLKDSCERKLRIMLSGDQPWNSGRSTGRQAATMAMPISSMPQNMRMLTIPGADFNKLSAALGRDEAYRYRHLKPRRLLELEKTLGRNCVSLPLCTEVTRLTRWPKDNAEERHASDTASNSPTFVLTNTRQVST